MKKEIEALLFYASGTLKKKDIASHFNTTVPLIQESIDELKKEYMNRGITIIDTDTHIVFATHPNYADLIKEYFTKQDTSTIGQAGSEVLAIIIYYSPVTRLTIDFIRGVNSTGTLRQLIARGLIDQKGTTDHGAKLYIPSEQLLAHLGIHSTTEFKNYETTRQQLQDILQRQQGEENWPSHEEE